MLAVVLVAASCRADEGDPTAATATTLAPPDTVVRIGVEDWPDCVNPLTCADDALHSSVLQHVLPKALELGADGEYSATPLLTEPPEPEAEDDGEVVLRYRIAEKARWSDGRPITSTDFLATWQAVMATPEADRTGYDRIVAVDDADPAVAVVTLDGPLVDWQELFGGASGYVLRADEFGAGPDLTGEFDTELPMSAGPFQLASWSEERAVLAATEPWEGRDAPDLDQVRLDRVVVDGLEEPLIYDMIVPTARSTVAAPDGFSTVAAPTTSVLGVWLDQRSALLQPIEHRRSVAAVVDADGLAEEVGVGAPVRCAGWVPMVGPWCEAAAREPTEPDADLASFGLASLGWVRGEEGVLTRDDTRFTVGLTHDPAVRGSAAVAEELSAALEEIGIATDPAPIDTGAWWSPRSDSNPTGVGVFAVDLGVSPRVADLYGCPDGPETSVTFGCPPEVVDAARRIGAAAPEDALTAVRIIGEGVAEQVLWIPVSRVDARSFVRDGRLDLPGGDAPLGGPLARLEQFVATD
ncbi:MAG: ABC transporter substrate-binding protein [Acidimicrobiales bacterium]|nr:ABC transporter substrate-binding protein [Acidimicrobiales bacterium]